MEEEHKVNATSTPIPAWVIRILPGVGGPPSPPLPDEPNYPRKPDKPSGDLSFLIAIVGLLIGSTVVHLVIRSIKE